MFIKLYNVRCEKRRDKQIVELHNDNKKKKKNFENISFIAKLLLCTIWHVCCAVNVLYCLYNAYSHEACITYITISIA